MSAVGAPSRLVRTSAATGVALAAAVGGHLAAGGRIESPVGLLTAAAALSLPAWWLTGKERGWPRLAAALAVGQLGAHALFTFVLEVVSGPTPSVAGQLTDPVAGHHPASWLPTDLMLLGHLLAAAVGAAWLRRGERRAWAMVRRAGAALHQTLALVLTRPDPVPADLGVRHCNVRDVAVVPLPTAILRNTIILRGPPLGG